MRAGHRARAVQRLGELVVENVFDQRALAAAADAGDGGERAERNRDVDVLEVVVAGADDFQEGEDAGCGEQGFDLERFVVAFRCSRLLHPASSDSSALAIAFFPLKYGPVTLPRCLANLLRRAGGDDLPAEAAGAGAEVDEAVGAGDALRGRARRRSACCRGREAFAAPSTSRELSRG